MTTEHEQPTSADDVREAQIRAEFNTNYYPPDGPNEVFLLRLLDAARLALAQAQADLASVNGQLDRMRARWQASVEQGVEVEKLHHAAKTDLALFAQQIVDQAEALGQEKAEVLRLTAALAERDAEITRLLPEHNAALKGELLLRQDVLSALAQAQARGDNLAKELSERNAHMDELHDALAEWDEQITRLKKELSDWADDKFLTPCRKDPAYSCATILACHTECQRFAGPSALLAEGYLSGKLNPFPERTPGAQALEIAERFRVFFRRPYPTSEAGVERAVQQLAQEIENVMRHNEAPPGASALEIACRFNSAFNICKYIHNRALCGQCCDLSRIIEAAEARGRAERDTERTERDGICFREGVEFGRAQMGKHGSALEATRDLFESLEGWRPTDDWAGVPARLKLLFDRTLHAIEVAKARDQAERDK